MSGILENSKQTKIQRTIHKVYSKIMDRLIRRIIKDSRNQYIWIWIQE